MLQTTTLFNHVLEKKVPYGNDILFLLECGVKSGNPCWAESYGMSDTVRRFLEEHPHLRTNSDVLEFLSAFCLGFDGFRFSSISVPTGKMKEAKVRISDKYDMPYNEIKLHNASDDLFFETCQYLINHFKDYLI